MLAYTEISSLFLEVFRKISENNWNGIKNIEGQCNINSVCIWP